LRWRPAPSLAADARRDRRARSGRRPCPDDRRADRRRRSHGGRRRGSDPRPRPAGGGVPLLQQCRSPDVSGIRLDAATKVFANGVVAVDSVDLTIPDGEFMVLVGPSGCGKSTLLRMIAGLEHVTSGTIYIGDEDVTGVQPRA